MSISISGRRARGFRNGYRAEALETRRLLAVSLFDADPTPVVEAHGPALMGGRAFYLAGRPDGVSLWASDGSVAGTVRVKKFGGPPECPGLSDYGGMLVGDGRMYFYACGESGGEVHDGLWLSDGTSKGTRPVPKLEDDPPLADWQVLGDKLLVAVEARRDDSDDGGQDAQAHARDGLWVTDGTARGTFRLTKGEVGALRPFGKVAAFSKGSDLWITDGTGRGTRLLRRGPAAHGQDIGYRPFAALGNELLYYYTSASPEYSEHSDYAQTVEIWKTDLRRHRLLARFRSRPDAPYARVGYQHEEVGDTLFFAFDDGRNGMELWKTDGTPKGTSLIKDIADEETGVVGGYPHEPGLEGSMTAFAGQLFFSQGFDLWKTDGTRRGTVRVKENVDVYDFVHFDGGLFFDEGGGGGYEGFPSDGAALWRTDGTRAGTVRVIDGHPQGRAQVTGDVAATAKGLVFLGADLLGEGLYSLDAQSKETRLLTRFDSITRPAYPTAVAQAGGSLYVGTQDGNFHPYYLGLGTLSVRRAGDERSRLLHRFVDGIVKRIDPAPAGQDFEALFTVFNPIVDRYLAPNAFDSYQLWRTDGTRRGTRQLTIASGFGAWLDGRFYFPHDGQAGVGDDVLWSTDGTRAGTGPVDLGRGAAELRGISDFQSIGEKLYFTTAPDGAGKDRLLWVSNGTASGTHRLPASLPSLATPFGASPPASPILLVSSGRRLFFTGTDEDHGAELWSTDGTPAGTALVADIRLGIGGSAPYGLTAFGGNVFFLADDGRSGAELWASDGTRAGTRLVKDINPGAASSNPAGFAALGDSLYFVAADASHGRELWRTDGTASGTKLVADIRPGAGGSIDPPRDLYYYDADLGNSTISSVGARLYFRADDGVHGHEPWVSDRTAKGTHLLIDLRPGADPSTPEEKTIERILSPQKTEWASGGPGVYESIWLRDFIRFEDGVLFAADDGVNGVEVWEIDP